MLHYYFLALDDSRYFPSVRQASVLLETWMLAARHISELPDSRGYHVLLNELLGNFL